MRPSGDRKPCVAYLQAPLVITNARGSKWSALFALEYAALFRGLLPFLARRHLPLPLGGTSNHFRVDVLKASGAWDPHNVTEDADLGLRLFRRGYRGGMLSKPTQETAPAAFGQWVRQRTRWLKGWLQTWLVLMRAPLRLGGEMGWGPFAIFQVLVAGMLLSALGHPLLIGFVGWGAVEIARGSFRSGPPVREALFGIDLINFFGCYLAFVLLARKVMIPEERRQGRPSLGLPARLLAGDVIRSLARDHGTGAAAVLLGQDRACPGRRSRPFRRREGGRLNRRQAPCRTAMEGARPCSKRTKAAWNGTRTKRVESYFSRLRRMVGDQHHFDAHDYLLPIREPCRSDGRSPSPVRTVTNALSTARRQRRCSHRVVEGVKRGIGRVHTEQVQRLQKNPVSRKRKTFGGGF